MNLLSTAIGGKSKFQVQDSDLEYILFKIRRFKKHIALSEKKPPLMPKWVISTEVMVPYTYLI